VSTGSLLADLSYLALGVAATVAVVAVVLRRRAPSGERARARWITEELARQEAEYPGGRFSDDECLARLEALEERWADEHGRPGAG
jgi:hypothetical protein